MGKPAAAGGADQRPTLFVGDRLLLVQGATSVSFSDGAGSGGP